MSKNVIAKHLSDRYELSDKLSEAIVDTVFDSILEEVVKGRLVIITNFGTFYPRDLGARRQRNPHTGEVFTAEPTTVMRFRSAERARDILNGRKEGGIRKLTRPRLARGEG